MEPDFILKTVNAVTSLVVILALIVTNHDLNARNPMSFKSCRKVAHRVFLSVFCAAIGFGEGMRIFEWAFDKTQVAPSLIETVTGVAWSLLGLWLIVSRPLTSLEVLCPFSETCPLNETRQLAVSDGGSLQTELRFLSRRALK